MKSVEENVELLSVAVLNEAQTEAEKILTEARQKAEQIRKRGEEQAAAVRKEILARANQEAERLRNQAIANAQLKARSLQLESRERLLNEVFQAAQKQLPSVQHWSDYRETAERLLREALVSLHNSKLQIRADELTHSMITDALLNRLSDELHLQLSVGDPLLDKTGVIVETADGHLNYDNTLETRLGRLQAVLRSPVYHILMGESI